MEQLKKQHACEIALYEEKITTMQLQLEEKDRKSKLEQVQKSTDERTKRIITEILKDNT